MHQSSNQQKLWFIHLNTQDTLGNKKLENKKTKKTKHILFTTKNFPSIKKIHILFIFFLHRRVCIVCFMKLWRVLIITTTATAGSITQPVGSRRPTWGGVGRHGAPLNGWHEILYRVHVAGTLGWGVEWGEFGGGVFGGEGRALKKIRRKFRENSKNIPIRGCLRVVCVFYSHNSRSQLQSLYDRPELILQAKKKKIKKT